MYYTFTFEVAGVTLSQGELIMIQGKLPGLRREDLDQVTAECLKRQEQLD